MTRALVWRDFWDIAVRWYGVTAEAAEWAHDWCDEYDHMLYHKCLGGSPLLEDFADGLKQDIADGCGDRLTRLVLGLVQEVL